ncbi:MAG: hypothetical protein KGV44_12405 [Flavobacteriaceae bacterium]|nr:hypothetical protein [Flavobacteriaceae bacterium]MBS9768320.1 hypothetical protein [Flavobacteriaceae bacterium]
MIKKINVREQDLDNYINLNWGKEIYNHIHTTANPKHNANIVNTLDFFNKLFGVVATVEYNYRKLPHETAQYLESFFEEGGKDLCSARDRLFFLLVELLSNMRSEKELNFFYASIFDVDYRTENEQVLDEILQDVDKIYLYYDEEREKLREFIQRLIFKYGDRGFQNKAVEEQTEQISIDLSDAKGTEKIIMLEKTGVLDFLRTQTPFNLSVNSLASLVSGITGMPRVTVQSYLNPICNPNVEQSKNPFKSKKTVNKVVEKFNSIGYKPLK